MSSYRRLCAHYSRAQCVIAYSERFDEELSRTERAQRWYPTMREILDTERGQHSLEAAVACFAITSQGTSLKANLEWTRRALSGDTHVGRWPNRQGPKIRKALSDPASAHAACVGPKVEAFYRAVAGDTDALVLDRWAYFAALGTEKSRDSKVTPAQRTECERAYRRLAAETGEEVRAIQAAMWLQVRETMPRSNTGKAPQYWDITH